MSDVEWFFLLWIFAVATFNSLMLWRIDGQLIDIGKALERLAEPKEGQ